MNSFDMIVNFFKQGGAFLYPIAAVFAVGIAVAIERFIYLTRVARGNRRLWSQLAPQIQAGNYRKAMEIADRTDSALSTIMKYGISRMATAQHHEDIERAMGESLIEVVQRIEKRTNHLAALANIGMLMGLFGTVVGPDQRICRGRERKPRGADQPALGQHLGRDEQHRARPRARDLAAARAHVSRDQDHRARKWPRNGDDEVPELGRRTPHRDAARADARPGRGAARHTSRTCAARRPSRMKSSSPLTYGLLRNHTRHRGRRDLTIIPMLDVMVILAFFLIFTAVFSRTSILELNLPGPNVPSKAGPHARARGHPAPRERPGRRSQ